MCLLCSFLWCVCVCCLCWMTNFVALAKPQQALDKVLDSMSEIYSNDGRHDEALRCLEDSLAIKKATLGESDVSLN